LGIVVSAESDKQATEAISIAVWAITFIASWIYCISSYGYFLGISLGWIPSIIAASIAAIIWPIAVLAMIAMAIFLFMYFRSAAG
jgi:hypothetical protein